MGKPHWIVPFLGGVVVTLVVAPVFLQVSTTPRVKRGPYIQSEEVMEQRLNNNAIVRRAYERKAKGDLDGALVLMDQLIRSKDGGGREFTVISWLIDADRDAGTLPHFRSIYSQRLRSTQGVSNLGLLYNYAEIAAEYGTEEDSRIILETVERNFAENTSEFERVLGEDVRDKAHQIDPSAKGH